MEKRTGKEDMRWRGRGSWYTLLEIGEDLATMAVVPELWGCNMMDGLYDDKGAYNRIENVD